MMMRSRRPFRATIIAGAAFLAALADGAPGWAQSAPPSVPASPAALSAPAAPSSMPCSGPADLVRLGQPLRRVARRLASNAPLNIVAVGSSSTAGAGASSPAASYPNRLQVELQRLFPGREINVYNRGVNGEEAREMLARFEQGVIAENPDLVLWQVGTNAVLRDHSLDAAHGLMHQGLERLKQTGADIVLIDPQFAPKVLAKTEVDDMVDLIATTAKVEDVNLFRRFAVMRYWRQNARISYETFLSPDELHMNDWSYACFAKLLAGAIAEAVTRPTVTVSASAPAR